jgi:hypothetical protein
VTSIAYHGYDCKQQLVPLCSADKAWCVMAAGEVSSELIGDSWENTESWMMLGIYVIPTILT